ncbi:MAG: SUMF1/EgtB/PvdO family nonheme iron enzyme [Planctomycetes bacterium]|nr:SUMF1/EgtB/PvdO family nonheme iron enzyme [Planctomycetota bacterium]
MSFRQCCRLSRRAPGLYLRAGVPGGLVLLAVVGALAGCGEPTGALVPERAPDPAAAIVFDMVVIEREGEAPPFLLDRFEVTNAQFAEFLAATGYDWKHADPRLWEPGGRWLRREGQAEGEHPVVRVTLEDARAWARWAGKRLPTFAEWVRAANRRGRAEYPWGSRSPEQYYTNSQSSGLFSTAPVGAFPSGRSDSGAFDMVGNVWEWTDSVPELWSRDLPLVRKAVLVYPWFGALLPGLDTTVRRERVILDPADPIGFPGLLPGLDSRPEKMFDVNSRVPVPYAGRGRLVVGGGFRNRVIPNFDLADVRGELVYEELERGICSIQLVEPEEWRDDLGFRCARDLGPVEVRIFLDALVRATPKERGRIAQGLVRMGADLVAGELEGVAAGADADLADHMRRIREELGR